jgi:predicted enzyme related to lactoylglutathione lyase
MTAMPAIRTRVHDVDGVLPFYEASGFALAGRRGPRPGGGHRIVIEVDDHEAAIARIRATGARFRNEPRG